MKRRNFFKAIIGLIGIGSLWKKTNLPCECSGTFQALSKTMDEIERRDSLMWYELVYCDNGEVKSKKVLCNVPVKLL